MDSLAKLTEAVRKRLKEFGITRPTPAQEITVQPVLDGKNVLLVSPTGMGKTEAVMLPIFSKLVDAGPSPGIRALYITPLRALNRDMVERLRMWGEKLGIDVRVRHGDTTKKERTRLSRSPPDILITTPETMQIMFSGRKLREALRNVRIVVVDEIHELAESSRGAQLVCALERLKAFSGYDFQRIGMSATIGNPDQVALYLQGSSRPVTVLMAEAVKKFDVKITYPPEANQKMADKLETTQKMAGCVEEVISLVKASESALVFVNTRDNGEFLGSRIAALEPGLAEVHHGSLSTGIRMEVEDKFKRGELKSIIATSSLELGIDVGSVDRVIQFSSPRRIARLVQRVGRSGHSYSRTSRGTVVTVSVDDVCEAAATLKLMREGKVEDVRIRKNPLDVLANQIVALLILLEKGKIKDIYEHIKLAYPFHTLEFHEFLDVVATLLKNRIVSVEDRDDYIALLHGEYDSLEDVILRRGKRRLEYFFDNISMIPDESVYLVVSKSGGFIGTMDESFVIMDLEEGMSLTLQGKSWRVIEIKPPEKDKKGVVVVELIADYGDPPRWVGEEIPVEKETAVLAARFRANPDLMLGLIDETAIKQVKADLSGHLKEGLPMPDHKLILVEGGRDNIIVNIPFGHRINTAISQAVLTFISGRTGSPVYQAVDPYRLMFSFEGIVHPNKVADYIKGLDRDSFLEDIRKSLSASSRVKWALFHSARKFGALSKKVSMRGITGNRLIDAYRGTIIFEEALRKDMWHHMDIDGAMEVLDDIAAGKIDVETHVGNTPVGTMSGKGGGSIVSPDSADVGILKALGKRLEGNVVRLVCLRCFATRRTFVRDLKKEERCEVCGSQALSLLKVWDRKGLAVVMDLKKKGMNGLSPENKKFVKDLVRLSNILRPDMKHGAMAMCARGVGPDTTARILNRTLPIEDEIPFLREVLRAEVNYARYRKFW